MVHWQSVHANNEGDGAADAAGVGVCSFAPYIYVCIAHTVVIVGFTDEVVWQTIGAVLCIFTCFDKLMLI